jgi:hypothetical protein
LRELGGAEFVFFHPIHDQPKDLCGGSRHSVPDKKTSGPALLRQEGSQKQGEDCNKDKAVNKSVS